jgi:hypothetical protein
MRTSCSPGPATAPTIDNVPPRAGGDWKDQDLVFRNAAGDPLDPSRQHQFFTVASRRPPCPRSSSTPVEVHLGVIREPSPPEPEVARRRREPAQPPTARSISETSKCQQFVARAHGSRTHRRRDRRRPHGFEDRGSHRAPSAPKVKPALNGHPSVARTLRLPRERSTRFGSSGATSPRLAGRRLPRFAQFCHLFAFSMRSI